MRTSLLTCLLLSAITGMPASAADDIPAKPTANAAAKTVQDSCVDVEVDGYHALSFDCLSKQMTPVQPGGPRPDPALASGWVANAPSNQLGLFNQSSTSNRMGNTFGKSAFPQRPAPAGVSPLTTGR